MIAAPLLIASITAASTAAAAKAGVKPARLAAVIGSIACLVASFAVAPLVEDSPAILSRTPALLFLDAYGALLLEKFTMAAAASLLLAMVYLDRVDDPAYYVSMVASLLGIVGVVYSGDLLSFFAFYALMNLSSYYFMAPRPSEEVGVDTGPNDSLTLYLVSDVVSMVFVASGFLILYTSSGATGIPEVVAKASTEALWASLALVISGFWVKLAIFPAHAWFPGINPWAPSPSSAFMASAVRVVGFYGATRMLFTVYRPLLPALKSFMLYAALVNIAVGCLLALGQDDLKRLVTCSSVGEGGVLMMAWGVASTTALQGVFFHVLNLVLIKCLFFSSIAYFISASDRRTVYTLRGASRSMLLGSTGFLIASLSTCAMPPLNGFHSKFLVFLSLVESGLLWAACAFVVLDLLMLAVLMKAVHAMYDRYAGEGLKVREPGLGLKLLIAVLIASCLLVGLAPSMFMEGAYKAALACLNEAWMKG